MEVKSCAFCSSPFRAYRKALKYCSLSCAQKVNATTNPRTTSRWNISLEAFQDVSETAPIGCNRSQYLADKLGCSYNAVEKAKRRYGYRWGNSSVELRKNSNRNTNVNIRKYVKDIGCLVCSENRVVDAAHIVAASEGGSYRVTNIMPLCPTHHRLFDRDEMQEAERQIINNFVSDYLPALKAAVDSYEAMFGTFEVTQSGTSAEEVKLALQFWDKHGFAKAAPKAA